MKGMGKGKKKTIIVYVAMSNGEMEGNQKAISSAYSCVQRWSYAFYSLL
jgi:hypothetical protein